MTSVPHAFQLLSYLIRNNDNIKDLKVTIPIEKIKNMENNETKPEKSRHFLEQFIIFNSKDKKIEFQNKIELYEFSNLVLKN